MYTEKGSKINETEDLFTGNIEDIEKVNIEDPIKNPKEPCCSYFVTPYNKAAEEAKENGDLAEWAVFSFLNTLVSFMPNFDTPDKPFTPLMIMKGKRSTIPSDLSESDIPALEKLAGLSKEPALRARLFDVLWELKKNYKHCKEASKAHIAAAEKLNTPENFSYAAIYYQRSLDLSSKLGEDKKLYKQASRTIQKAVEHSTSSDKDFWCYKLLRIIHKHKCGDQTKFAKIAEKLAKDADKTNKPRKARSYFEVASGLWGKAQQDEKKKTAEKAAAETHIKEASKMANDGNTFAASRILSRGIEALRRVGIKEERISTLKKKLVKYQEASQEDVKKVSKRINISEMANEAIKAIQGKNLTEALLAFVYGHSLIDLSNLRNEVIQSAKKHPLTHLLQSWKSDEKGRVIKQKPGILTLEGDEFEKQLEEEMFLHAGQFNWPLRVFGFIKPASAEIVNEHHPSLDDLSFIVKNNPFIPPGHEFIYLKGIHAGFYDDFLVAAHLLVPQIENSIRFVLESRDVDVSNLLSDGTQSLKSLGNLLNLEETVEIFGEGLCFELRGCLVEKFGYNFRHRLAHGFVSGLDCHSTAAVLLWWLVFHICLSPIYNKLKSKE